MSGPIRPGRGALPDVPLVSVAHVEEQRRAVLLADNVAQLGVPLLGVEWRRAALGILQLGLRNRLL